MGSNFSASLKGEVEFKLSYADFSMKIDDWELQYLTMAVEPQMKANLKGNFEGEIGQDSILMPITTIPMAPITVWVGIVPIVFTPEIAIDALVSAKGKISLSATMVDADMKYRAGMQYADGQFDKIWENNSKPVEVLNDVAISLSGELKVQPVMSCNFRVYNQEALVGLYCGFYTKLKVDDISFSPEIAYGVEEFNPKLKLTCGITFGPQAKLAVFSKKIAEWKPAYNPITWDMWERHVFPVFDKITFNGDTARSVMRGMYLIFPISNYGFCWGVTPFPTVTADSRHDFGENTYSSLNNQPMSLEISNMQEDRTYYIRPFFQNMFGTFYGEVKDFKTQPGAAPSLEIDGTGLNNITAGAASYPLTVTGNIAWTAEKSNAAWLTLNPTAGTGNGIVAVSVAENTATEPRTATITVTASDIVRTVTVTQAAASTTQPGAELKESLVFTFTGNEVEFNATAKSIAVDWGDGTEEKLSKLKDTAVRHTYAGETEHTVRIQAENLSVFRCTYQGLTALDVSNCTALTSLDCSGNRLSALDVSKNTALTDLNCLGNKLSALDVSKNTALTELYCFYNQLSALDVSKNTALTKLLCTDNQLSALDVSGCTALTELYCDNNKLSALDVSKNTALTTLSCNENQLSELNVSGCTALTRLYCSHNQLGELNVSGCTALDGLFCDNNQLSALDVSKNTKLTWLNCFENQLNADALNRIFTDLPDLSGKETGVIRLWSNPGTDTCNRSIASAKNWKFVF
jgi:Leucine-rich repeat (LRR) protein